MHIVRRCLLGLALVVSWVGSLHAGHPYVHVRYGYGYGYHGYFPDYASYSYIGWPYRSYAYPSYSITARYRVVSPWWTARPCWTRHCLPRYRCATTYTPCVSYYNPCVAYGGISNPVQVPYQPIFDPSWVQEIDGEVIDSTIETQGVPYEHRNWMFPVETEWPSLQVQHREALSPIKVPDVRLASSLDPIPTQQTISSEVIVPGLQRLVSAHSRDANARTIEPVTLATPTSSVWEQSAIQWTDTMVRDGDGKAALDACERMLEIRRGLPSGVYLRHGVLAALEGRDSTICAQSFIQAWQAGSRLSPKELPMPLQDYVSSLSKEGLEKVLQSWAKQAVESDSHESLFGVACLLQLDGQDDRAREYFRVLAGQGEGMLQTVAADFLPQ